jgi:hypothetical protein
MIWGSGWGGSPAGPAVCGYGALAPRSVAAVCGCGVPQPAPHAPPQPPVRVRVGAVARAPRSRLPAPRARACRRPALAPVRRPFATASPRNPWPPSATWATSHGLPVDPRFGTLTSCGQGNAPKLGLRTWCGTFPRSRPQNNPRQPGRSRHGLLCTLRCTASHCRFSGDEGVLRFPRGRRPTRDQAPPPPALRRRAHSRTPVPRR